jgi:hypothetical protein
LGVTTIWILPPWSSMTELIHNFKLPPSATFFIQTRSTGIDQIVSAPVFPSRLCAVVRIIRFEFFWKNAAWDRQEKKIKSCWNFFFSFFSLAAYRMALPRGTHGRACEDPQTIERQVETRSSHFPHTIQNTHTHWRSTRRCI